MRLAIGIRSQLYRIAIATMHFCFGFHFYDDPDRLSKILVNISWAIFHSIMGSHSIIITGGSKANAQTLTVTSHCLE